MANTPQKPVHLLRNGEFAEDNPVDPPAMSTPTSHLLPNNSAKAQPQTKRQKMEQALASLYDDDEKDLKDFESPAWNAGQPRTSPITDVTIEDVDNRDLFEVKAGDIGAEMEVPEIPHQEVDAETGLVIRTDWLGTSQFYLEPLLELQRSGGLCGVIAYREDVAQDVARFPYDPVPLLTLGSTHGQLGFSDIAVANSHRALLLIEATLKNIPSFALSTQTRSIIASALVSPQLDALGKTLMATTYQGVGPYVTQSELLKQHCQAYQTLLSGLLGTAANWEGLVAVKAALELYPRNVELQELQNELRTAFLDISRVYKELLVGMNKEELIEATRMGKIQPKKYPWMDQDLYKRTPATLREANKRFESSCCEVKAVVFGDAKPSVAKEGEDVGPLGIFASRDINEGDIVMVDRTVTGVSNVPSSKLQHCDACMGCLLPPYMHPERIVHPPCCNSVAFCSLECYRLASEGYHQVLCGHDFDWLYEKIKVSRSSGAGAHWKSVNFLRVVAVVLADMRKSERKIHPLQHPLIARMSANFLPEGKITSKHDISYGWLYFTNVIAPTQILLQLGVNIFADESWSPEVIQTIFWKIENNANMASTNLSGAKVQLVNINPDYLFLNHSCEPNLSWHGACPDGKVNIEWLRTPEGGLLQPGCSAVWCIAARDIKKDEELKISYVGNPQGDELEIGGGREGKRAWLLKWFDNGCGCTICEEENRIEREDSKDSKDTKGDPIDKNCETESVVQSSTT